MTTLETVRPGGRTEGAEHPDRAFRALWAATGVSQAGSAVSNVAIPLCAAVTLRATPAQMTLLTVIELAPALLIRVPAAEWSDRLRRPRAPVMAACNLVQAAVMGLIPALWWAGALTMATLLVLAAVASSALGVYAALSNPLLNEILPRDRLVEATGRLQATRSAADIGGPALGGGLLAVLAAPGVVLADAVSFLASAALLTRVRAPAPAERPARAAGPEAARGNAGGTARLAVTILRLSQVRAMMGVAFVQGVIQPVLVLFLLHDLHMRPSTIGLLLAFGAVGGVTGGMLVGRVQRRFGTVRTVAFGAAVNVAGLSLLPFASAGPAGMAGLVLLELGGSLGGTLLIASVFGGLQAAAPRDRVARVMAIAMTLLQVATLAGVPLGGALSTVAGTRWTMIAAFGLLLATELPALARWAASGWAPCTWSE